MEIFQPCGINALVADSPTDVVKLVTNNKIHLAILDMVLDNRLPTAAKALSGMQTLKIIRQHDQLMPCILLAQQIDDRLLAEALALGAFSVLAKPIDLAVLAQQIDRLFRKYYASDMFSAEAIAHSRRPQRQPALEHTRKNSAVFKWNLAKKQERSNDKNEDQTSR